MVEPYIKFAAAFLSLVICSTGIAGETPEPNPNKEAELA